MRVTLPPPLSVRWDLKPIVGHRRMLDAPGWSQEVLGQARRSQGCDSADARLVVPGRRRDQGAASQAVRDDFRSWLIRAA